MYKEYKLHNFTMSEVESMRGGGDWYLVTDVLTIDVEPNEMILHGVLINTDSANRARLSICAFLISFAARLATNPYIDDEEGYNLLLSKLGGSKLYDVESAVPFTPLVMWMSEFVLRVYKRGIKNRVFLQEF